MVIYTDGPLSFMIYCMTSSSVQKVLSVWKKNTSVFHQNFTTWTYDHKHDDDHDQVLVERVRQTAWEMHYAKTDSIIYLFRWPIKRLMYFHSQFIHTWSSLSISDHIDYKSILSSPVSRMSKKAASWASMNAFCPTSSWASTGNFIILLKFWWWTCWIIFYMQKVQWCCCSLFSAWQVLN